MIHFAIGYFCLIAAMSAAAFAAYGFDKRRSMNGGRRVPERTLQILAFLGGWPGAYSAQRYFRHKTQKVSFLIVFWGLVVLHLAVAVAVANYLSHLR